MQLLCLEIFKFFKKFWSNFENEVSGRTVIFGGWSRAASSSPPVAFGHLPGASAALLLRCVASKLMCAIRLLLGRPLKP
jgi:hypothetical protein